MRPSISPFYGIYLFIILLTVYYFINLSFNGNCRILARWPLGKTRALPKMMFYNFFN